MTSIPHFSMLNKSGFVVCSFLCAEERVKRYCWGIATIFFSIAVAVWAASNSTCSSDAYSEWGVTGVILGPSWYLVFAGAMFNFVAWFLTWM